MRGDRLEMQVGLVVDDRGAHSDPDRAAEVAHHVEQAGGVFQPLRRQAAKTQSDTRRHREDLREAAQHLRDQQLVRAPVMRDEAIAPHRHGETGQAEHHQPAWIELARQHHIDRRADQRCDAGGEDRQADLPGAQAAHIPQEQRGQIDCRENANAGDE